MTWIAWRVQRLQYLVAAGVVAALALWLAVSGLNGQAGWSQLSTTGDTYGLYALPGLLGLALGSQLIAAEIERGTNRVAWTQSITRMRWLAGKLLVGGLASVGLVAALCRCSAGGSAPCVPGPTSCPSTSASPASSPSATRCSPSCSAPPSGP